jgi:hypothetical protein
LMMAWRVPYDNCVNGKYPLPLGAVNVPQCNNLARRFCQLPHNKGLTSQNIESKEVVGCRFPGKQFSGYRPKEGRRAFGFAKNRPAAHKRPSISRVAILRVPTGHFGEIYFSRDMRLLREFAPGRLLTRNSALGLCRPCRSPTHDPKAVEGGAPWPSPRRDRQRDLFHLYGPSQVPCR